MAGITQATAQTQLDLWIAADAKVASGQSYTINGRTLTRADAGEISNKIEFWNNKVEALSGSRRRGIVYGVPR